MAPNFPNMEREKDIQIYEDQRILLRRNTKITTLRHGIITLSNIEDKENVESMKSDLSLIRQLTYQRICQEKVYVQNGVR